MREDREERHHAGTKLCLLSANVNDIASYADGLPCRNGCADDDGTWKTMLISERSWVARKQRRVIAMTSASDLQVSLCNKFDGTRRETEKAAYLINVTPR